MAPSNDMHILLKRSSELACANESLSAGFNNKNEKRQNFYELLMEQKRSEAWYLKGGGGDESEGQKRKRKEHATLETGVPITPSSLRSPTATHPRFDFGITLFISYV